MSDIIQTLRESDVVLLKAQSEDLAKWSKLKHTKKDLELFLNFNIAEIKYKKVDGKYENIICTSNTTLIKLFSLTKDDEREKTAALKSTGIRTNDHDSIGTWDLKTNSYKTVKINSWQIENFISITPKNILILDEVVRSLLKS